MIGIIAVLTMLVGCILAITQSDIKRMLAYSSIAHAGFLLVGFVGLHPVVGFGGNEISSVQAVLFYLVTYGFMTVGAFAVVTVVRDAGRRGDPPVALGRPGQGVAGRRGRLRVLPARHGRHPADLRLHRQVGGVRRRRCPAGRGRWS